MKLHQRGKKKYYQLRYTLNGKRKTWSTQTADKAEATRRARIFLAQVNKDGFDTKVRNMLGSERQNSARINDVMQWYREVADVRPVTIRNNLWTLKKILEESGLNLSTRVADFRPEHIHRFQQGRLSKAAGDAVKEASIRRTCNTMWRMARSIWSVDAPGLPCPARPPALKARMLKQPAHHYRAPDKALWIKVYNAMQRYKEFDPPVYAAFMLASAAGFRKGEVVAARKHWLSDCTIRPQRESDFVPKTDTHGSSAVDPDLAEWLLGISDTEYILPGKTKKARCEVIDRCNAVLKELGWGTNKIFHDLRKYFGFLVNEQMGLKAAQVMLRHARCETTSQYYADFKPQPIKLVG